MRKRLAFLVLAAVTQVWQVVAEEPSVPVPAATSVEDPFEDVYKGYNPGFTFPRDMPGAERKFSSEPMFYTLNLVNVSSRANALVVAAKAMEAKGQFREAMEVYQKIIDEYPEAMYRVNDYGVFVPIARYCQLRILAFPKAALEHYQTKYDARARDDYEVARRRNSLEGLAEIRDNMLCTSYGPLSMLTLGMSALDRGNYMEALEYFDVVWEYGGPSLRNPELAMSMALCRKALGLITEFDEKAGLIGHWTFDEGQGNRAADSSGLRHHATVHGGPHWIAGKLGRAIDSQYHRDEKQRYQMSARVSAAPDMAIGVDGKDFSVAFWVRLRARVDGNVFEMAGGGNQAMLSLGINYRNQHLIYALSTESEVWEKGETRTRLNQNDWTHVALVHRGGEVRVYLNGRLALRKPLAKPVIPNRGGIRMGTAVTGSSLDDVRLYDRSLLDREVAAMAGTTIPALTGIKASQTDGDAPLTVQFTAPEVEAGTELFWEFGDGSTGTGTSPRHTFAIAGDFSVILAATAPAGTVSVGRTRIKAVWPQKDADFTERMDGVLKVTRHVKPPWHTQAASAPNVSADDYTVFPPTPDPLGIASPVWARPLTAKPMEGYVFAQPVVTRNSVIYRHKNIIYCRSLLNGDLRWKNDIGGRVIWQSIWKRQYPQEDVLVQDGLVFTPMYKVGPTLIALDEITGEIKWAYGPMAATTDEDARMRFEAAPAGGPQNVYAGYVLDNIAGATHVDTEYGIMAFESTTGRVKWRTPICRLRSGLFAAGFARSVRNRIRSFQSPPLYHQGTVYYCTNAGAIAALDALSGRIKWIMKYPYYAGGIAFSNSVHPLRVHDATRPFGAGGSMTRMGTIATPHVPMTWYNQRPLVVDEALYVLPVDAPHIYRIDRRTGKVDWRKRKGWPDRFKHQGGTGYFMGVTRSGELLNVYSPGDDRGRAGVSVQLVDPRTGKTTWTLGDLVETQTKPVLKYHFGGLGKDNYGLGMNGWRYMTAARPFLSSDGKLVITSYHYHGWPFKNWTSNLAVVDLNKRKRVETRHYITPELIDRCAYSIEHAEARSKPLETIPNKDEQLKRQIAELKAISKDTIPENRYPGELLPFSRVTVDRFGTRFELRMSPASVAMLYDKAKVKEALASRQDSVGLFARAELAVAEDRLEESVALMEQCLDRMSSEDLDFRATVNQLLYQVHKRLARGGARSRRSEVELKHCLGMSQSVGTLADEIETLFAFSDASERKGDYANAVVRLQSVIRTYGAYEYPVSTLMLADAAPVKATVEKVLAGVDDFVAPGLHGKQMKHITAMLRRSLGLYFGELAPVEKSATMRAGDLAVAKILAIQRAHPDFAAQMEQQAETAFAEKGAEDERVARLSEYPGTKAAQACLEKTLRDRERKLASKDLSLENRAVLCREQWTLADMARICQLTLPDDLRARLLAPAHKPPPVPVRSPLNNRETDMEEARGTDWLALERRGQRHVKPRMAFLGGRVRKKFDTKFVLQCIDTATGKVAWKAQEKRGEAWFEEIRLRDKGDEPGFFDAYVYEDIVVTHGRYDVLAFHLDDGKLKWRCRVPFDFEIGHAVMSGNLLMLAGDSATVVLHLDTDDPRGEIAWQEKEEGNLYVAPYFDRDRLVEVRKMPFNLTVRYRSTGKLIGRLALPDLTLFEDHPLVAKGPRRIPVARDGSRLVLTDGFYYFLFDVARMKVIWKRLIDQNDVTREPPMRFELNGDFLAVIKQDYDVKTIYMLSSRTGDVLWKTDPKSAASPKPIHSMSIRAGKLYGIRPHAGQGFYFVGLDCKTGAPLFPANEQTGYGGKPEVELLHAAYGDVMVTRIKDRKDFELKAFRITDGKLLHQMQLKGAGDFDQHGRASATVQDGRLLLLGKNTLLTATEK